MYINDPEWDKIVSEMCDIIEMIESVTIDELDSREILVKALLKLKKAAYRVVNLEDEAIPEAIPKELNAREKLIASRNEMRDFVRLAVSKYAKKEIKKQKKRKRKSSKLPCQLPQIPH
jgi:hypothetical protein